MNALFNSARAFFIRDAQNALSYKFGFVFGLVKSLVQTVALWLPAQLVGENPIFDDDGGFLAYSVTGSAMLAFFMASYGGFASSISAERGVGTLESVLVTRAPLSALLLGGSTWSLIHSLIDAALTLLTAYLLFDIEFRGSVFDLVPIILLTNLSFVALGFLSAAFTVLFRRGDPFRIFVGGASVLLGGVFYPTSVLPSMISWIGELLPITHGARALRAIALRGESLWDSGFEVLVLLGFNVILLPLGLFAFYRAVERSKLEGTLFQY